MKKPSFPGFYAEVSVYRYADNYVSVSPSAATGTVVVPQVSAKGWLCALHAGACLLLTENPAAAGLCWGRFAQKCSGGLA